MISDMFLNDILSSKGT